MIVVKSDNNKEHLINTNQLVNIDFENRHLHFSNGFLIKVSQQDLDAVLAHLSRKDEVHE